MNRAVWLVLTLPLVLILGSCQTAKDLYYVRDHNAFNEAHAAYQRGEYEKSLAMMRPLAEDDGYTLSTSAKLFIGDMYKDGVGVPQDYEQALAWFKRAAESKTDLRSAALAAYSIGWAHYYGEGVDKDYVSASRWFARSVELGYTKAENMANLALRHPEVYVALNPGEFDQKQGSFNPSELVRAEQEYERKNYHLAFDVFSKFARMGSAEAQFGFGLLYFRGHGTPQNEQMAARWIYVAAASGFPRAEAQMGTFYAYGDIVPKDREIAIQWFRKAAEKGIRQAQNDLAIELIYMGAGDPDEVAEGVAWMQRAANYGLAMAQRNLGELYLEGLGVPKDRKKALEWYRKAAAQGDEQATSKLTGLEGPRVASLGAPEPASKAVPSNVKTGAYHALVVGNSEYRSFPRLQTPDEDARQVARILRDHYGFVVSILQDATRDELIEAIDGYRNALTESDNLLIYYAGHGVYDKSADRGYWLPVDATEASTSRWVSNVDISDRLRAIPARHVLVVADSCYSGTLTRSVTRGVQVKERPDGFYSRLMETRSRTVLTSGALEPVSDEGGGGYSVFARAFIDTLLENSGPLEGVELFTRVRQKVKVNANQIPQYGDIRLAGHEVGGDFLLVKAR